MYVNNVVLTNGGQEGECDQEVSTPIKAVDESKRSSSDLSWEYFSQEQPSHWAHGKNKSFGVVTFPSATKTRPVFTPSLFVPV